MFGLATTEVRDRRAAGYDPVRFYETDAELRRAIDQIGSGQFSPEEPRRYRPIIDSLLRQGDTYMVLADYRAYIECQERVDALYFRPYEWTRRAILTVAGMGRFSSDQTVRGYAEEIWNIKPMTSDPA